MRHKLSKILIILAISVVLLLGVRLSFFLKDGTNDSIETLIFWLIFIFSLVMVGIYLYILQLTYDIGNKYFDKIVIFSYLFILEILFHVHHFQTFTFIYIFSLLLGLFLIVSISILLPKKISKWYDIILILSGFFYIIGQDIYLTLFNGMFSLIDIVNAKEGADFAKGVYTFSVYHIIYVFMVIGTLILYLRKHHNPHLPFKYGFIKLSQIALLLILLVNVNAVYPVKSARLHTSDHYIYYSNYDKERIASKFALINMFYRDVAQVITPDFSYKSNLETVDHYFDNHHKDIVYHDKHGIYEGKNLVFILAESFDDLAISETLTPNIYEMQNQGLNFTNHYVPVYPRTTCDTEMIINTGLIPSINDGPTCYMFNDNTYNNSLASLFNDKGYQTRAFHNNDESFYTRDTLYIGFAYDQFSGRETLGLSLEDIRYDGIFFDALKDHYKGSDQEPFYSFMLTLSGHSPYTLDNLAVKKHIDKVNAYYGDTIPLDLKYYIASQIEVDILVGKLMDDLQASNQLDDTVIIFMNDHYPYTLNQSVYESAKGIHDVHEKQKGTLIIWSKDTAHQDIDRLTSSFDLLPTIASLFNLDMNYSDYVGIDMFDDQKSSLVYFKDYYVYDGERYIDIFNPEDSYQEHIFDQAILYYEYSIAALKTNYFKD